MSLLSAVDLAAVTATLSLKRGRYILTAPQRTGLLSFFSSTGRTASELPLAMADAADEAVAEEWEEFAVDAGLKSVRRMDTACICILEPDTAFSKVSVSAYTDQLSIRIRIQALTKYPHTGAVCGYKTHIGG
jgi:hypothetical protein